MNLDKKISTLPSPIDVVSIIELVSQTHEALLFLHIDIKVLNNADYHYKGFLSV